MKPKYFALGTGMVLGLIYSRVNAQPEFKSLEEGSLEWKTKNQSCFSVLTKEGAQLPPGRYESAFSDFGAAEGEIRFEVGENGILNGIFEMDIQKGAELIKATLKNGCYEGEVNHFFSGDLVGTILFSDEKVIKTIDYTDEGESIGEYTYNADKFKLKQTYSNGSYTLVEGLDMKAQLSKHYTADGILVAYMDKIHQEQKRWNSKGELKSHFYEESVDEHFKNTIEVIYENGVVQKKSITMVPADEHIVDGYKQKVTICYHPNGNIKEDYLSKPTLKKTGKDFRIVRKYNLNGDLTEERATRFDSAKGLEIEKITYFENGIIAGEDEFETAIIDSE